jgi:ParB-like chromosome segregation protein Spo0J
MKKPKYQLLPDLSAGDYEALKRDIDARGVLVPIEYDDAGEILDGHHRLRACRELKITEWPRVVRIFLSEQEKRTHVRQLNLARRHLNQAQRRELIADELRDNPEKSTGSLPLRWVYQNLQYVGHVRHLTHLKE